VILRQKSDPALVSELGNANRKIETLESEVASQAALLSQFQRYQIELETLRARLQANGLPIDVPSPTVTADPSAALSVTPPQ
jgi:hypothetical protein